MDPNSNALAAVLADTQSPSAATHRQRAVIEQADLVAVIVCDTGLKACEDAVAALHKLAKSLPEGQLAVLTVAIKESKTSLNEFVSAFDDAVVYAIVASCPAIPLLLRAMGIKGATMVLPEISFLDRQGRPVAIDVWKTLKEPLQQTFTASTFPHGWRTNVWRAHCLPVEDPLVAALGPCFGAARVHPDAAVRAGLYPGDAVVARPLQQTPPGAQSSLCVYVNPPAPDGVDEDAPVPEPQDGELWLTPGVWSDLGLDQEQGQGQVLVTTAPYLDLPEAASITLAPLSSSPSALALSSPAASRLLTSWLGLPDAHAPGLAHDLVEAVAQVRAGADEGQVLSSLHDRSQAQASANPSPYSPGVSSLVSAGEVAWLEEHVRRAACRYAVLSQGQTLAVPTRQGPWHDGSSQDPAATVSRAAMRGNGSLAGFRVIATEPRFTAVVVGPDTRLQVHAAPVS